MWAEFCGPHLDRKRYIIAGGDVGFILNPDPRSGTIRGADVAVNLRESVGENPPLGYLCQGPLVAIEVVSPGSTAADLELRTAEYLGAGSQEVWLLYPDTRRLYLYRSGTRDPKVFEGNERLQSVLECEFEVSSLFEI